MQRGGEPRELRRVLLQVRLLEQRRREKLELQNKIRSGDY